MIEFFILAFIIAKRKGYKLSPIFNRWWSITPSILFGLFYIYLEYTIFVRDNTFLPYQYWIKTGILLSYVPLIVTYDLHKNDDSKYQNNDLLQILTSPMFKAGFCLCLGSFLNRIAMLVNNNKMPVFPSNCYWTGYISPDFMQDGIHVLGNAYTKLILLTDWIDTGFYIASPADMIIRLYVFIIIYYSIKESNKNIK